MNNTKLIVLFLLLCNAPLHSQVKLNYQQITTEDGLSQGLVFDISQSRDGFLPVSLGAARLRTETAALYAVNAVQLAGEALNVLNPIPHF